MAGLLGGGGGLRGHGELPLNADINVTSLVDVAFVLLIIFMITAPIMQGGADVRSRGAVHAGVGRCRRAGRAGVGDRVQAGPRGDGGVRSPPSCMIGAVI